MAIRRPAVAGAFYPGGKDKLTKTVDGMLGKAKSKPLDSNLVALIVPHAGYVFSGQCAAEAYHKLAGKKYDTVVLVGPSHHVAMRGKIASVYAKGFYSTPLGNVEIDEDFAQEILKQTSQWVTCLNPLLKALLQQKAQQRK